MMFCCWSGGKESMLSLSRSLEQGADVRYLVNMVNTTGEKSRSHGLPASLLRDQAEALGIPVIQRRASWDTYEGQFKKVIAGLKKQGITGGVFGDIDLQGHRDWVERVCRETGIRPSLPLWKNSRERLLREFIGKGFKAVIVALRTDRLGREWLGRELDERFITEIRAEKNIDICGEEGEYHTFVYDGPLFKRPVAVKPGRPASRAGYLFYL